jgi:RNA polymerase sigma-70 factor (ECF subfamily)
VVNLDLETAFSTHRPALLRHCYRMLGSFAEAEDLVQVTFERAWKARSSYRGEASVQRWLYTIATNACLNMIGQRQRQRTLPQLERAPSDGDAATLVQTEAECWIGPAADDRLFPDPAELTESRETVALAFVALLQRVPPRQRAALLLKDVAGWSADEIASALDLSVPSVNSAVHRGRAAVQHERSMAEEPTEETVRAFVRAWETRDLDALVGLLRRDVTLAMPPYAEWFLGVDAVLRFFRSNRFTSFWTSVTHVEPTRANGVPAFAFIRGVDGTSVPHSIMAVRFFGAQVAEMTVFIGACHFVGFDFSQDRPHSFGQSDGHVSKKGSPNEK